MAEIKHQCLKLNYHIMFSHLFSKDKERRWERLFSIGTIDRRFMNESSFAFRCQNLTFFFVNADIGIESKTEQGYNLQ